MLSLLLLLLFYSIWKSKCYLTLSIHIQCIYHKKCLHGSELWSEIFCQSHFPFLIPDYIFGCNTDLWQKDHWLRRFQTLWADTDNAKKVIVNYCFSHFMGHWYLNWKNRWVMLPARLEVGKVRHFDFLLLYCILSVFLSTRKKNKISFLFLNESAIFAHIELEFNAFLHRFGVKQLPLCFHLLTRK